MRDAKKMSAKNKIYDKASITMIYRLFNWTYCVLLLLFIYTTLNLANAYCKLERLFIFYVQLSFVCVCVALSLFLSSKSNWVFFWRKKKWYCFAWISMFFCCCCFPNRYNFRGNVYLFVLLFVSLSKLLVQFLELMQKKWQIIAKWTNAKYDCSQMGAMPCFYC